MIAISTRLSDELRACRAEVAAVSRGLGELAAQARNEHQRTLDALRVVRDQDARSWERLWRLRDTDEYALAFDEPEPLVTIIVTTFNRPQLLRERALQSVLDQSYERFECIVVGDAAAEAAEVVGSFSDERLRFVNLPYRGPYPARSEDAWLVGGTTPHNTGLALARGRWIGVVNDDDALRPTCVESLLRLARADRAEVPYGCGLKHVPDAKSEMLGRFPPGVGAWALQSSLIHSGLRFLPLQPTDWLFEIPHDGGLLERMLRIGVRFAMLNDVVWDYYPSLLWTDRPAIR
jgi:glycosyltransferase involved in cell wall biosynthesis